MKEKNLNKKNSLYALYENLMLRLQLSMHTIRIIFLKSADRQCIKYL